MWDHNKVANKRKYPIKNQKFKNLSIKNNHIDYYYLKLKEKF